jgi:hypothetical protein
VFDVADPARRDTVIKAGPEVNVPNVHLRPVEVPPVAADGFSQLNPSPTSEVVRRGQEAMERKRRGWDDWLAIAEALEAGRTEVMRALHTNDAHGRRYEKAMSEWLIVNKFKEINKATRSQLLDCLKHKVEIEKWRARLTDSERWKFNHPDTVLRKWEASTVVPDPTAPPKVSPVRKLKDSLVALQEENDRMRREIERGGGDLWAPEDRPRDIARVILDKLSKAKAEKVAREILKTLRNTPEERAVLEAQIDAVRQRSVKEHVSQAEWADVDRKRRRVKRLQEMGL